MWIDKAGYSLRDMTAKQLEQKDCFAALEGTADTERLREQVRAALAEKGAAYRLMHRGRMVGCLVFARTYVEAEQLTAAHPDVEGLLTGVMADGSVPVLQMAARMVAPGHESGLEGLEHSRDLVTETGAMLAREKLSAMLWNDVCWQPSKGHAGFDPLGFALGMTVSIALGAAMGNVSLGICFGPCFALLFGLLFSKLNAKKKNE